MDKEPETGEYWLQGHYATRAEAEAMAADIDKLTGLQEQPAPHTCVTRDPQGGWCVWVWEDY